MAESQQLALLRLYNGLARERRASWIKVLEAVGLADVGERDVLDATSIADFTPSFQTLAARDVPEAQAVLAINKLGLLIALATTLHTDSGERLTADELVEFLMQDGPWDVITAGLIAPDAADPDGAMLELAQAIAATALDGLPTGVIWQADGPIVSTTAAESLVATIRDGRIEVGPELLQQPSVKCKGNLVKVKIDGQGEYAVYLETLTLFDTKLPEFQMLDLGAFESGLLQPIKWPGYHPFWCTMTPATAAMIGMPQQQLDTLCPSGQPDLLLEERVGFCEDANWDDLFPRTFLCFRPRQLKGNRAALRYGLVVVPDGALALDDGVISVDARTDTIKVRITKRLFIRALDHRTEGHALAELSCQFGWSDQTRHLIMKSLRGGGD